MSITPSMTPFPLPPVYPLTQITPFTYRDGMTYLQVLNGIRDYITSFVPTLNEYIEGVHEHLIQHVSDNTDFVIENVEEFHRIHAAYMADVDASLMALNDSAMANLLNSDASETWQAVTGRQAAHESIFPLYGTLQETVNRAEAAGGGIIQIPAGEYEIPETIRHGHKVIFQGAGKNVTILTYNDKNSYAFELNPLNNPGDTVASLSWKDLTLQAKYGVKIQESNPFESQSHIKGITFKNVRMRYPDFEASNDPLLNSTHLPTLPELTAMGVGINAVKTFDMVIDGCELAYYGLAILLDGSDLATFSNGRLNNNSRHIWFRGRGTYGGRSTLVDSDVIRHYRIGGVYTDAHATRLRGTYFEPMELIGYQIMQGDGSSARGLLIEGNSFDIRYHDSPLISLSSSAYNTQVVNNHAFTSTFGKDGITEIRNSGWDPLRKNAVFFGNNPGLVAPDTAVDNYLDPYVFEPGNIAMGGGVALNSYPYIISPSTGRTVFRTDVGSMVVQFRLKPGHRQFRVIYTGRSVGGGGFRTVKWNSPGNSGGNVTANKSLGFTSTTEVETITENIVLPEAAVSEIILRLEMINTEVEYERIEILPHYEPVAP